MTRGAPQGGVSHMIASNGRRAPERTLLTQSRTICVYSAVPIALNLYPLRPRRRLTPNQQTSSGRAERGVSYGLGGGSPIGGPGGWGGSPGGSGGSGSGVWARIAAVSCSGIVVSFTTIRFNLFRRKGRTVEHRALAVKAAPRLRAGPAPRARPVGFGARPVRVV